jgi:hypothetical protein
MAWEITPFTQKRRALLTRRSGVFAFGKDLLHVD